MLNAEYKIFGPFRSKLPLDSDAVRRQLDRGEIRDGPAGVGRGKKCDGYDKQWNSPRQDEGLDLLLGGHGRTGDGDCGNNVAVGGTGY